ncbi:N2227-domain-containing protein [Choiromyces venosus 120613-1]|uniref:N2227-domain-containing protein n=1 Tax=Choiromyces venosus 120613-1 TaxID=1336337 RepID=A0A3N4K3F4_9PEZI|nr:N2227-domain-containing protein [Choiromyces venosus 120613-1]
MARSTGSTRLKSHPRRRLLAAMVGLLEYSDRTQAGVQKKRSGWWKLNDRQREILSSSYLERLNETSNLIKKNNQIVQQILDHSLAFYNISFPDLLRFQSAHKSDPRPIGDHTSVVQSLKHFVRDWSTAGAHERESTFPQILSTLETLCPEGGDQRARQKILVPGAGLGRLAYEISALGFTTVANEYSFYMSMAHRWVLSLADHDEGGTQHTYYPFVNWWSHQRESRNVLRGITFPEVQPSSKALERYTLLEGDFTKLFLDDGERGSYDAVVTLFFIDTARNIVEYLENIHAVLKAGGTWINLGPLLYGTGPWVEPSLGEILQMAQRLGFELLPTDGRFGADSFNGQVPEWKGKVRGCLAGYSWDKESLSRNAYEAQFWVARKVR